MSNVHPVNNGFIGRTLNSGLACCDLNADISLIHTDPPEKLQQTCPTCPLLLPVESQEAVNAARITLASYRRQFIRGAELGVKTITRASAQV